MPVITEFGYLELSYLVDPYGSGSITHSNPSQIQQQIVSAKSIRSQISRDVNASKNINQQIQRQVFSSPARYQQVSRLNMAEKVINQQISRSILSTNTSRQQTRRMIQGYLDAYHEQIKRINMGTKTKHEQADRKVSGWLKPTQQSIRRGGINTHEQCQGYLVQDYLTTAYLGEGFCVHVKSQVNRVAGKFGHSQINLVLYNTYNLRILCEFPSRGASGTNWTSTSTEPGDFSVYNLNSDIVEEIWRTATTVKTATLTCDTEVVQGVFLDTLGILNHNLTTSASVVMQSSNDPTFTFGVVSTDLVVTEDNIYYVTPTAPITKYRYWRFQISDTTNTNAFLSIGTIVFGASVIMQGECYVDELTRGTKHFSDKVATEGFTNVSNDRAIKYSVGMEFRLLKYSKGNYSRIRGVFDIARTSLKCLWIPTPVLASRFAVFGKLESIPTETHKVMEFLSDKDYISFSVQVDESL